MRLPKVAVVILNWNGEKFLNRFLPSVVSTTWPNLEIIVADNASSDGSIKFLEANYPTIRIIQNGENGGYTKGYNMALKLVEADYYVLLNSDVEVCPGWIEPVIALMERKPAVAFCQPKLLQYDQKDHFEYAGACGGWLDADCYPFARGRIFDTCEKDAGQYNDAMPCFWATGAALFARARVFHELGGFDEFLFAHMEEIDLCWRAQNAGYEIYCCPQSVVYHVGGGTLPKANSFKSYLNFRNNLVIMHKNLPKESRRGKIIKRLFLDGIAAARSVLSGQNLVSSVFKAHMDYYKWVGTYKRSGPEARAYYSLSGVYRGSILKAYFIQKKKTFSEIVKKL